MDPVPAALCLSGIFLANPGQTSNLQIAAGLLRGVDHLDHIPLNPWTGAVFLGQVEGCGDGLIFAAVFVPAGVGAIVSAVLRTQMGTFCSISLFMMYEPVATVARRAGPIQPDSFTANGAIAAMLVLACLVCLGNAEQAHSRARGGPRMNDRIIFEDVSKFYGEVLGVNRISLSIPPGITTLVGPNGSGKTTIMNLMTGLVQPSSGRISVLGSRLPIRQSYSASSAIALSSIFFLAVSPAGSLSSIA